uniref:Peptidase M24 domain-containing protein n=1 Tax=Branchiostoma floridae TaxID=7739 RepID=C3ZF59_BRAFL|eukprot:XP_002593354.1 hypothetical protein BRAFLDRAFT_70873 [Branchiostoma floridae]
MWKILTSSSRILWEKGLPDLQKLTAAVPVVIGRCQHSETGHGPGPAPVGSLGSSHGYTGTTQDVHSPVSGAGRRPQSHSPTPVRQQHVDASRHQQLPLTDDMMPRLIDRRNGQKVHRRGLELIRPGARCCDIATELNEMYREHGLLQYRSFGYGHSFGSLCHYYGREAELELREDIPTVLEPGMVVSMEPMIMIPEGMPGAGGYREHDILVVTEDGAEDITGFPFGPEHNIIKT